MSPMYEYRCDKDNSYLEIRKDFSDDSIPDCVLCKQPMSKIFTPTPTIFNAGGFYKTDNRGQ
jgi:putative FmdB family regulatory protein